MNRIIAVAQTSLTRLFMSGLLAILPLVLTVAIIGWVANFLRSYVGPETMIGDLIRSLGVQLDANAQGTAAYLLGIVVVVSALIGLGVLFELGAKRIYQATLEWVMKKIPLVGNLYGSLRQLIELFDKSEQTELKAMSVVYCYFGSTEGPGVLALMPSSETIEIEGRKNHVVIIPTAPVPFGGGLIFFPVEQVRPVPMTVDQFVSIYVSMGVTTPEFFSNKKIGKAIASLETKNSKKP
ncbi:MAG: DUF502 domain-containing protein [Planctomycetaceae bacterium]|nr:DUF502 domain-containing protein [Planctomycetaceae bacterium]